MVISRFGAMIGDLLQRVGSAFGSSMGIGKAFTSMVKFISVTTKMKWIALDDIRGNLFGGVTRRFAMKITTKQWRGFAPI